MRDFLNEDEIALLKETCETGQIEIVKEHSISFCDPLTHAYKMGSVDTFKECLGRRNLSSIAQITEQACSEIEDILALPFGDEFKKEQTIAFLRGKAGQARFILDRLVALKYLKNTLETGNNYFIPGNHLVFVKIWRNQDLGPFMNLRFNLNALS